MQKSHLRFFFREISIVLKSPAFIVLTLVGNSFIGLISTVFFYVEQSYNPKLLSFMDALWWGFATATTTGYGDITPVTHTGKILGIILMLSGTALFAMFTALFADIIISGRKGFSR